MGWVLIKEKGECGVCEFSRRQLEVRDRSSRDEAVRVMDSPGIDQNVQNVLEVVPLFSRHVGQGSDWGCQLSLPSSLE